MGTSRHSDRTCSSKLEALWRERVDQLLAEARDRPEGDVHHGRWDCVVDPPPLGSEYSAKIAGTNPVVGPSLSEIAIVPTPADSPNTHHG